MADKPNSTEPGKRPGRWYQIRLRTLLIGVVLLGSAFGYVAHEARIVRARKNFFAAREQRYDSRTLMQMGWRSLRGDFVVFGDKTSSPGLVRRWLGDQPVDMIFAERGERVDEIARLFPEAAIAPDH